MKTTTKPSTILISALGGEGGGVLSQWLTDVIAAAGFPVQSTSIPGVAQRTGATTYYIEFIATPAADLNGLTPVFALTPMPGAIDVMVTSELLEAGRAMQNGFVNPARTTLIASTHRMYAINERVSMTDGRFEPDRILTAAKEIAQRPIFFDMNKATIATGSVVSAVLLGAIAGSGALPMKREVFEQVIRASGIAVEANLSGFAAGFAEAESATTIPTIEEIAKRSTPAAVAARPALDRAARYPDELSEIVGEAIARLVDFQDLRYATEFLDRLDTILALDGPEKSNQEPWLLTREVARHLATWMTFEDVIRVADLKTRAARVRRVREEVRANPNEPVEIIDFLKPGIEEITAIMPPALGQPIQRWAERRKSPERLHIGMHIKTTSVSGFLLMWTLGRMRWLRRRGLRFRDENALQLRWLDAVRGAAARDYGLAVEVAACARLIKGYGSTYHRGRGNFLRIVDDVVEPVLAMKGATADAATVQMVREAALADPDGKKLNSALDSITNANASKTANIEGDAEPQRLAASE
jgi:indolepyruvate ferredoxin oxidoreductase beta subunit